MSTPLKPKLERRAKPVITDLFDARALAIDAFAGGAGAATGTKAATGEPVDIAINHDPVAIEVFQANNPETECYRGGVTTKKDKIRLIGNSVVPHMQRAVVAANLGSPARRRAA